jgi:hypothetical protein
MAKTPASYSGGLGFKSRPGDRLFIRRQPYNRRDVMWTKIETIFLLKMVFWDVALYSLVDDVYRRFRGAHRLTEQ